MHACDRCDPGDAPASMLRKIRKSPEAPMWIAEVSIADPLAAISKAIRQKETVEQILREKARRSSAIQCDRPATTIRTSLHWTPTKMVIMALTFASVSKPLSGSRRPCARRIDVRRLRVLRGMVACDQEICVRSEPEITPQQAKTPASRSWLRQPWSGSSGANWRYEG